MLGGYKGQSIKTGSTVSISKARNIVSRGTQRPLVVLLFSRTDCSGPECGSVVYPGENLVLEAQCPDCSRVDYAWWDNVTLPVIRRASSVVFRTPALLVAGVHYMFSVAGM